MTLEFFWPNSLAVPSRQMTMFFGIALPRARSDSAHHPSMSHKKSDSALWNVSVIRRNKESGPFKARFFLMQQRSGGFAGGNTVSGRLLHVEGLYLECAFDGSADEFIDFGKRFPVVLFCVFFGVPEAYRQHPVRSLVRNQNNFIRKARLGPQKSQDLFTDGAAELSGFSGFGGDFDNTRKHKGTPFVGVERRTVTTGGRKNLQVS